MMMRVACLGVCAMFVVVPFGCEKKKTESPVAQDHAGRVIFPRQIEVEDESVNQFVREAMKTCFAGEYPAFRDLWADGGSSFSADKYERGWKRADQISIKRLKPVQFAPSVEDALDEDGSLKTTLIYYIVAEVRLSAEIHNPNREVVLWIIPEDGGWRFRHPPKAFFASIAEAEAAAESGTGATKPRG